MTEVTNQQQDADSEASAMSDLLCAHPRDRFGRQIEVGDTLKVFHFTGSRRRKYFMYKYVEAEEQRETWRSPMLRVSHLNPTSNPYYMKMNGEQHSEIEIVQGFGPDGLSFEDRPRT